MGKRTKGNRDKSGKLKRPSTMAERSKLDRGCPRVKDRIDHFNGMVYQGGGHGKESCDAVGILFLTGNLDHFDYEAGTMMLALRKYQGHRDIFLTAMKAPRDAASGNMEPQIRTTGGETGNDGAVAMFERMSRAVGIGSPQERALQSLMFDGKFANNEYDIPHWVMRFLLQFRRDKGMIRELQHHEKPSEIDRARLEQAGEALEAICDTLGAQKKQAAA